MTNPSVKKVKPYPIQAQMTGAGGAFTGQILKLVMKGFFIDLQGKAVKVGEIYQVNFELPVMKFAVAQSVTIIKTIDRPNLVTKTIDRMAECHFTNLGDSQRQNIHHFLQRIGQTDNS